MFILHNKRFDMTSWFGFPEYIFCSERDIHLFIFFTYLVRRILNIHCNFTRLSTEGLGPRHGEVRRAHQMLNAAALHEVVFKCSNSR